MRNIDVIIVNWNAGKRLWECLKTLSRCDLDGCTLSNVIVVDNASADGSCDALHDIPLPLKVIRNRTNRGYAAACNQGACHSEAEYLLFLNPDTSLVCTSLKELFEWAEHSNNSRVGIMGVRLKDSEGATTRSCAYFPSIGSFLCRMLGLSYVMPGLFKSHCMTDWDHTENRQVPHVCGAFYLVRRRVYEELEGFDERFFLYLEDVDFSLRAAQKGWATYYLASVAAYHVGGGCSSNAIPHRLCWDVMSRIIYGCKHFVWWQALIMFVVAVTVEPIARLLQSAFLKGSKVTDVIRAYAILLKSILIIWTDLLCNRRVRSASGLLMRQP